MAAPEDTYQTGPESGGPCDSRRYAALIEQGVLGPDDPVELLGGSIVAMAPQSASHAAAVHHLQTLLVTFLPADLLLRVQLPLEAGRDSVPEPDLALVEGPAERWWECHPKTARLVIEVADSSLAQDRLTKSWVYAAAGVTDYWIVNLRDRSIEHRSEADVGARLYRQVRVLREIDSISTSAISGASWPVAELIPGYRR